MSDAHARRKRQLCSRLAGCLTCHNPACHCPCCVANTNPVLWAARPSAASTDTAAHSCRRQPHSYAPIVNCKGEDGEECSATYIQQWQVIVGQPKRS
jgi:hypothetical protein